MSVANQDFPSTAIAALERGNKIDAIKCVRMAQGIGLKEAKDIVEQYLAMNPNLKNRVASANAESARRGLQWLLFIAVMAVAVYYYFVGSAK